jgi:sulfide:quinone oxidoreductase
VGALRTLIAGAGVAALEAALALRDFAAERVEIELLAAEPQFWYRPLSVVEPFGTKTLHGVEIGKLARAFGADVTQGTLARVDPEAHVACTGDGAEITYDALLIATGVRPTEVVPGALTFRGPADDERFRGLLRELESGSVHSVVFGAPGGVTWALPLYELALQTAVFADRGLDVDLALVTPEDSPLALFGAEATSSVGELLRERRVALHTGRYPVAFGGGELELAPTGSMKADRVVALPRLRGEPIEGIPADADGFIPTDRHGHVDGVDDVFAAGDVTTFPVKQGGLAAQQAVAAAEAIAALAGAEVEPRPFQPVLRGLVLTGSSPLFVRAEPTGAGQRSVATDEALWWPPAKIAGRYLAPFLAEHADAILQ